MTASAGAEDPVPRQAVPGPHNQDAGGSAGDAALPCLLDQDRVQFTASGRAAILLGLEALALPPTARILVPTYHCPTMVSPALALGLQVGFYPITGDGRPDLAWLDHHLPTDARVLCVAHLFGLPLDLRDIQAWCQRRGLLLLEDCAHAMFGAGAAGAVGTQGDIAIASLPKFFAALDGGLLRLRDTALRPPALQPLGRLGEARAWLDSLEISARYGRLGRWQWWAGPLLALKQSLRRRPSAPTTTPAARPQFDASGEYARIDQPACHRNISSTSRRAATQAGRGRVVGSRRDHYRAFTAAFAGRAGLRPLMPELPQQAAPYVFPLWMDEPEQAYQAAREQGLPVSRWDWLWPGVPDLPGDQGKLWSVHVLQLHCHQDLSATQRDRLIQTLLAFASAPSS
jgi:perosamine synthetase